GDHWKPEQYRAGEDQKDRRGQDGEYKRQHGEAKRADARHIDAMHAGRFVLSEWAPSRSPVGAASRSASCAARRNDLGLDPRQFRLVFIVRHGGPFGALWAGLYLGFAAAATSGSLPLHPPERGF